MKIADRIAGSSEPLFSCEIVPPPRGRSLRDVIEVVETLAPLSPAWIDVTSHAPAIEYVEQEDGSFRRRSSKKRPGTLGICGVIQNRFKIDTVAHLLCEGFSKEETEDALIELNYLGIHNVLALRGDPTPGRARPSDGARGHRFAADLVVQIRDIARGRFLDDEDECQVLDFCVGVAGYPEKHFEAPNAAVDLEYLKQKVDAGAEFIVTQMFFENRHYFEFVERCRAAGIEVPIVPGIKILRSSGQLSNIPKHFHVDLPDALVEEIMANPDHTGEIGSRWAERQVHDLLAKGAPGAHFYVLNDASLVADLVAKVWR